eukprot:GFKZ01006183.1.p2 GENE.GFKZ01006183.1~~GFKZ01006183.1.p2  ORF type:complete len:226 (+),score=45.05 GFKZ01006183.1:2061-2738(+)
MAAAPTRDFQFFAEIVDSFKAARESSPTGKSHDIKVPQFLDAMTMFLRIFDALSNPFFSEVVKKDVDGNIKKLRAAAAKYSAETLEMVMNEEAKDPKLLKLIKNEKGAGCESGTVAMLWMKRMMQFVLGLLKAIVADAKVTLSSASRASYAATLRHCHWLVTRNVFDAGLRFAPSRETFYKNLAGGVDDVGGVERAMVEFLEVFEPTVGGMVDMYKEHGLEPHIK